MKFSTGITDPSQGDLGLVETCAGYVNDLSNRYWSLGEKKNYVNLAQDETANKINSIYREYFVNRATTPTVANQSIYALPAEMINMIDLAAATDSTDGIEQPVKEIMIQDRYFYQLLDQANNKSDFGSFFVYDRKFEVQPTPASAGMEMRIFYVERIQPMTANDDVSRIPVQHHELLAVKAAQRCMVKSRQSNVNLSKMEMQLVDALEKDIGYFTRLKQERTQPFRGTYGPYAPHGSIRRS